MRRFATSVCFILIGCITRVCVAQAKAPDVNITIQVNDKALGESIAGATVTLNNGQERKQSQTDDTGQCDLAVPAGTIQYLNIGIKKEGYAGMAVQWRNFPADKLPAELDFSLEPGVSIGGKVVDEIGKPVVGAAVNLDIFGEGDGTITSALAGGVHTDSDGKWVLENAPTNLGPKEHLDYNITGAGLFNDNVYRSAPEYSKLRDRSAVLTAQHAQSLSGKIIDPAGRGVSNAVIASGEEGWWGIRHRAYSDANGNFTLTGLHPGSISFTVLAKNFAPEFVNATAPSTAPVMVRLNEGKPLRLHIVDKAGTAIGGVNISVDEFQGLPLLEYQFRSNSAGEAVWEHAPAGQVTYDISKSTLGQIRRCPLSPTTKPITITLGPKTEIRGTVVDAATGQPIKNFNIITGVGYSPTNVAWITTDGNFDEMPRTGHDGQFVYQLPTSNSYQGYEIRIQAEGYYPQDSRRFADDEGRLQMEFKLVKGQAIAGTVYSPEHKPLSELDIYLIEPNQNVNIQNGQINYAQVQSVQSDANGHFSFSPQPSAFDLVCVNDSGIAELKLPAINQPSPSEKSTAKTDPTVRASRPDSYDLVLQAWAKIQGTLMVGSKPGANEDLRLTGVIERWDPDQPRIFYNSETKTDSEGHFTFEKAPPGKLQILRTIETNHGGSCGTWYEPVSIQPGQKLDVHIGGTGRPIIGRFDVPASVLKNSLTWFPRITEHGSNAHPGIGNRSGYAVVIQPDGRFRADDVPPGTYDLDVKFYPPDAFKSGSMFQVLATARLQFTVPPIPGGRSDEPLNLGTIPASLGK